MIYHNPDMLDYGEYGIESVNSRNVLIQAGIVCGRKENKPDVKIFCDVAAAESRRTVSDEENFAAGSRAVLHRGQIHQFSEGRHEILVELAARK